MGDQALAHLLGPLIEDIMERIGNGGLLGPAPIVAEEARHIEQTTERLARKVMQTLSRDGGDVSAWGPELRASCAAELIELGGLLQSEHKTFTEHYNKNVDSSKGYRLLLTRRIIHAVDGLLSGLLRLGVDQTADMQVSCCALFCLLYMRTPFIDPYVLGMPDPLGLSHLRCDLAELGFLDRIVSTLREPERERSEGGHAWWYLRRALLTSLLDAALRDQEVATRVVQDTALFRSFVCRLRAAVPLPSAAALDRGRAAAAAAAAGGSPRQGAAPQAHSPAGRRPTTAAAADGEADGAAGAAESTPVLRMPLRRRMASPVTAGSRGIPRRRGQAAAAAAAPDGEPPPDGASSPTSPSASAVWAAAVAAAEADHSPSGAAAAAGPAEGPPAGAARRPRTPSPGHPAKRRRGQPTELLEEGVFLPRGHPATGPVDPLSIEEVEVGSLLQVISSLAGFQEALAPCLQLSCLECLLELLNPLQGFLQRGLAYGAACALTALSIHKRLALHVVEKGGVQRVLKTAVGAQGSGHWALLYTIGGVFAQICNHAAATEKLCLTCGSAADGAVAQLVEYCAAMLRYESVELRRMAANVLSHILQTPMVLRLFDDREGQNLSALHLALQACLREAEELETPESKHACQLLAHAVLSYLSAHLLISTASLWPSSRRFGRSLLHSAHRKLPCEAVDVVLRHLEQPVDALSQGPDLRSAHQAAPADGPLVVAGTSLLTAECFRAAARLHEIGTVGVLLRLVIAVRSWFVPMMADVTLDIIKLLASLPWLHLPIARYTSGTASVLSALLGLATGEDYVAERVVVPRQVSAKALESIRVLVTPAGNDEAALMAHSDVWQLFRLNDGVRAMLHVLRTPVGNPDTNRLLACRILLALSWQPTVRQMLAKLGVPQLISDLMQNGPADPSDPTRHFALFRKNASALIHRLTRLGAADGGAGDAIDVSDHALRRLERLAVVTKAPHQYSQRELAAVVHEWLQGAGLQQSAKALKEEARLGSLLSKPRTLQPLDAMVTTYLKQQHLECPQAVSLLPRFSLRSGPQPALRAARHQGRLAGHNVAQRLFLNKLDGGRGRTRGLPLRALDRQLVHSRYRTQVLTNGAEASPITAVGFIHGGEAVVVGTEGGVVMGYSARDPSHEVVVPEFDAHDEEETAVTGIESSTRSNITALWSWDKVSLRPADEMQNVKLEIQARAALFSTVAAQTLIATPTSGEGLALWDIEAQRCVKEWTDNTRAEENDFNVACLNAIDTMALSSGALYDVRTQAAHPVHRFDKFVTSSTGVFAPTGNEVIIDKEVWDLRTYRLLSTVPVLGGTRLALGPTKEVVYGWVGARGDTERDAKGDGRLSVVDSRTLGHIHTTHMAGQNVRDFAMDPVGALLACAVYQQSDGRSSVKIMEIGRQRFTEDDGASEESEDAMQDFESSEGDDMGAEEGEEEGEEAQDAADMLADVLAGHHHGEEHGGEEEEEEEQTEEGEEGHEEEDEEDSEEDDGDDEDQ